MLFYHKMHFSFMKISITFYLLLKTDPPYPYTFFVQLCLKNSFIKSSPCLDEIFRHWTAAYSAPKKVVKAKLENELRFM